MTGGRETGEVGDSGRREGWEGRRDGIEKKRDGRKGRRRGRQREGNLAPMFLSKLAPMYLTANQQCQRTAGNRPMVSCICTLHTPANTYIKHTRIALDCDQCRYSSCIIFSYIPTVFNPARSHTIQSADPKNPTTQR